MVERDEEGFSGFERIILSILEKALLDDPGLGLEVIEAEAARGDRFAKELLRRFWQEIDS